jgi:murein L,D-transpeptidase YcbB/YkuD
MKVELVRYYNIEKKGAWEEIKLSKKKYKQGDTGEAVKQLKQRLYATGDLAAEDTTALFTSALHNAVKRAEKRFGFNEDGVVSADLINELNIPIKGRIEQLLINMERMRWLPKEQTGNRIVANIPEFKLHVYERGKQVFAMNVVVGKEGNKTVVFNDELKHVVFSPYWNVPRSIVRNEILPALQRNANYLAKNNMEQTGFSNGLPVIRQKPGRANALGKVKFIFPNSYSIYFHDTPSKSLFSKEKRAFSHGCIRLAEPKKLAAYLLRNQPDWTDQKIEAAMNSKNEKWVALKEPVPVFISYFTAWVDNDGLLNFREDIYGHDKKMGDRLFEHNRP